MPQTANSLSTNSSNNCRSPSTFRASSLWHALPIVGLASLAFLIGIVVAIRQLPPYYTVRDAWIAYCALVEQQGLLSGQWPEHLWYPADDLRRGLVSSNPSESFGDYTLYSSADNCRAILVDREGNQLHQWHVPFHEVFTRATHVPSWISEQFVLMRRAIAFPNGDLLALYETITHTPSGCGLAKFDLQGNVLWTYSAHTHHDVCVGDDGRIYVLNQNLRRLSDKYPQLEWLSIVPIVEDTLTILSANGEQLRTISLMDALFESPYFRPMLTHVDRYGDITHSNTVDVVSPEFAAHHPGVSGGDLIVCLRNLNLVGVVSPLSGQLVWATTGPWNHPHDPLPLENGNLLIFDNYLIQGGEGGSGVVEFDPENREIVWTYLGDKSRRLRSDTRSCQQLLANGNVLINEADHGRIIEVTRAGQTVWEYIHPKRGGENEELIPVLCGAHRYTHAELPFVDSLTDPPSTALSAKRNRN